MLTIYLCFLAGGVVLPFISFIMGFLSNDMDMDLNSDLDVNTDISLDTDADIDTPAGTEANIGAESDGVLSIGLIPTSFLSIAALAIVFGATGAIMTIGHGGKLLTFLLAVIFGYLAGVIVQTIIKSLKKIQTNNRGINENELLLYDGKVIDTILPGQLGTVSFVTLKDERVSYPARCEDKSLKLETGRIVRAKEFHEGIFIVEPKNKYE